MDTNAIRARLEQLRAEIRAERISYGEIAELQALAEHIDPSDVELLEWAGVPEHKDDRTERDYQTLTLADGTEVTASLDEHGTAVIQIDTPSDTDQHERLRVWVNDALMNHAYLSP